MRGGGGEGNPYLRRGRVGWRNLESRTKGKMREYDIMRLIGHHYVYKRRVFQPTSFFHYNSMVWHLNGEIGVSEWF